MKNLEIAQNQMLQWYNVEEGPIDPAPPSSLLLSLTSNYN